MFMIQIKIIKIKWINVLEAQQRLIELEAEKQRLDDELARAQKKISVSEKAVASLTIVEPVIYNIYKINT